MQGGSGLSPEPQLLDLSEWKYFLPVELKSEGAMGIPWKCDLHTPLRAWKNIPLDGAKLA